jgi:hypothetical protein
LFFFIFFICSNTKLHLSWLDNNEKNYCEKIKKSPLTSFLKILLLRSFWSFRYTFFFGQILNFSSTKLIILKKLLWKIWNCPLMSVLDFLMQMVF